MSYLKDQWRGLDAQIEFTPRGWLKEGKLRVFILNEDGTYNEFFVKLPLSYVVTIKRCAYVVRPECVRRGKYPFIIYFYNNPMPLALPFQRSQVTALSLRSQAQLDKMTPEEKILLANTPLDAEALNLTFTTRVVRWLYSQGGFTWKGVLIILVVVAVIILVILQLTGKVDVIGALTGKK